MQVKVFESHDIASGLKMVKEELGPDALILSTKTIRSKKLGLLGKKSFEITAAVDSLWPHKGGDLKNTETQGQLQVPAEPSFSRKADTLTYNSALQMNRPPAPPLKDIPAAASYISHVEPIAADNTQLQSEVNELKGMIKDLGREMLRRNTPSPKAASAPSVDTPLSDDGLITTLRQRLLDCGISTATADAISGFAGESLSIEELSDLFAREQFVKTAINDLLQVSNETFPHETKQHRIALVGPTGVGKTTTLAKIAATYLANHSPNIAFITIDTYRIAAVEQLKVYGEIMNIPVEVVISPEQLETALLKFRDKDLILIDTAGRSPQDTFCIDELTSFLRPDLDIKKHLVLSAATRENEIYEILHRFSGVGIDNTIITKIDECTCLGILLDIQINEKIPFSYITNGQRVPEDIMPADKDFLTQLIMSPGKGISYE